MGGCWDPRNYISSACLRDEPHWIPSIFFRLHHNYLFHYVSNHRFFQQQQTRLFQEIPDQQGDDYQDGFQDSQGRSSGVLVSHQSRGEQCNRKSFCPLTIILLQIVDKAFEPSVDHRREWLSWLSLDDQLWHQCLATYHRHQEVERATGARASPDWAGVQQTDDD